MHSTDTQDVRLVAGGADPLVSVVMSVFNGGVHLDASMQSILRQTYPHFEFIIIDDGSTDGSNDVLDSYRRSDGRVRVYGQSNEGLVASLRRGAELARGRYIARMDADDVSAPERFASQVAFLEANPAVGVLGSAAEFIDKDGYALGIVANPLRNGDIQRTLPDRNAMWHPSVMMRRTCYVQAGGYRNVADAEDYDLWLRMAEISEIANLPDTLLHYRIHPNQGSVSRCRKQAIGSLVAQVSAEVRRAGSPDPLLNRHWEPVQLLADHHIDDARIQTAFARGSLSCLRSMYLCGNMEHAEEIFATLSSRECALAPAWVRADAHLWMARVHWRRRSYWQSMHTVWAAFCIRPTVLGRPIKALAKWMKQLVDPDIFGLPAMQVDTTARPFTQCVERDW